MNRRRRALLAAVLVAASGSAMAACPPLSVYRVSNASVTNAPLADALGLLLEGTAWTAEVSGVNASATVTFTNVSGPLDRVVETVVKAIGEGGHPVSSIADTQACTVRINGRPSPSAGAPATGAATPAAAQASAAAPAAYTLKSGDRLSDALRGFARSQGWELRWNLEEDYVIDVDIAIPQVDVISGVTWVVQAYQAQGGLRGVTPRFARGNRVAVIEQMDVREASF